MLGIAGVTTYVFQRLRQPVVLGYLLAGMIVGPHVAVPVVANEEIVRTLSELGVVLLMFALGLEFSLSKLAAVGPSAGVTAAIQSAVAALAGYLAARGLGWTVVEALFTGAIVAVSSTTIIAKVYDEERIGGRLRELVVGILLVEDLIAIAFMTALTGVASGAGLSAGALGRVLLELALFLGVLLGVGIVIVPRFIRAVVRLGRAETTLIASVGVCFAVSYIAQEAGYSVALGAFLAGSLVAEAGHVEEIEHLVVPVRDVFAAIFFVSVGMSFAPGQVAQHWAAIGVLTAIVVAGKFVGVSLGAFLTGAGVRTAVKSGMSLGQIGEFSFIIAVLGQSLGVTGDFLYPVTVAVSALTTLTTPWLIRSAEPVARWVDHRLPPPLQTFATLYGTWLERLSSPAPVAAGGVPPWRRFARLLAIDSLALAALIALTGFGLAHAVAQLEANLKLSASLAHGLLLALACLLAVPLVIGMARSSRRFGDALALSALPRASGRADLDAAPRRALELTLRFAAALAAAIVVLALTQPFLPALSAPIVLLALSGALAVAVWRGAADLESHVRAGAQAVLETLASYAGAGRAPERAQPITEIQNLLHGLGAPVAVELDAGCPSVGRSLAELDLRGRTGATVLAIARGADSLPTPAAGERLRAGDVLALAGTHDAVEAARALLCGGPEASQ
ncbi:MAG TPA: cation:proton antiporter [Myxococcota bacterium]|nr:cation:proton antiporter [Myxococcota bacterium]